jgi:hypothetical protein
MPAPKSEYTVSLRDWQFQFLSEMARTYGLSDESKALRCLINYAKAENGRRAEIFTEVRCLGTDGKPTSCGCSGATGAGERART